MPATNVQEVLDRIEASKKRIEDEHSNMLALELIFGILLVVGVIFFLVIAKQKAIERNREPTISEVMDMSQNITGRMFSGSNRPINTTPAPQKNK